jgi:hypothetical protein
VRDDPTRPSDGEGDGVGWLGLAEWVVKLAGPQIVPFCIAYDLSRTPPPPYRVRFGGFLRILGPQAANEIADIAKA